MKHPDSAQNLVELLSGRAEDAPERVVYTFIDSPKKPQLDFTFSQLDQRARAIAQMLQSRGAVGERVVLIFPCNLDFIAAFFGCLYAGSIAVPLYPFTSAKHLERATKIVGDARARFALMNQEKISIVEDKLPPELDLECLAIEGCQVGSNWKNPKSLADHLAFLQYTSGSTGAPKGVMISHGNLLANFSMIQRAMGASDEDIMVSWLPMYHDMGLIGAVLQSVYTGMRTVLMEPATMIRPMRWLEAIDKFSGTITVAPNFAYDLCNERISESDVAALDLSSLRVAFNGAEPVRAPTIIQFQRKFAAGKLRNDVFLPCYGLAEATLIVAGRDMAKKNALVPFNRAALTDRRAIPAELSQEADNLQSNLHNNVQTLVGVGFFLDSARGSQDILICVPGSWEACSANTIGEICVRGPHIALGYWNNPALTEQIFARTSKGEIYLRTGDLGFLDQDLNLFITSRLKDLVIVRGKNYAPQDLEITAQNAHPKLRGRSAAAFSTEFKERECLVIVQEVPMQSGSKDCEEFREAIHEAIMNEHGIAVHDIRFINPNGLLKTSSGKIRRQDVCQGYVKEEFRWITA